MIDIRELAMTDNRIKFLIICDSLEDMDLFLKCLKPIEDLCYSSTLKVGDK